MTTSHKVGVPFALCAWLLLLGGSASRQSGVAAITIDDLVLAANYDIEPKELPLGDENVEGVQLETSVHLYSGVYDYIYVNGE